MIRYIRCALESKKQKMRWEVERSFNENESISYRRATEVRCLTFNHHTAERIDVLFGVIEDDRIFLIKVKSNLDDRVLIVIRRGQYVFY